MAELMSNHLKAVLLTDDIRAGVAGPSRSKCSTVQHFEYRCEKNLDADGMPFGFTGSVVLRASVRIGASNTGKTFLERLKQDSRYPFTFIFNPTFGPDKKLADYADAMVVYGYVVEVEEKHVYSSDKASASELKFSILVSTITYLGTDSDKTLYITHSSD